MGDSLRGSALGRSLLLCAMTTGLAVALTACGGGGDYGKYGLVQKETLTVCSDVPYPPLEMEAKGGGYTGFDMDLMRQIATSLGLKMQVKDVGFDGLQSGATLAAGQCDIAASAMTITKKREKHLDFSNPYFDAKQSLLVPKGSGIKNIKDLAGKKVGVQQGTTGQMYTKENAPDTTTIVAFPSDTELFAALKANQVDAILQDIPPNTRHAKQNPKFRIVQKYDTNEHYGFAVQEEGKEELLKAVNQQLKKLRSNGTYDKIYDKYFSAAG